MSTTYLPPLPDGVIAEVKPLRLRPSDVPAFTRELTGRQPELVSTRHGWPVYLVENEDRFVAVLEFLDYIGVVFLQGPRDAVLGVIAEARPDWRDGHVIALGQLWEER